MKTYQKGINKSRFILRLAVCLLLIGCVSAIAIFGIAIYAQVCIDEKADIAMFEAARGESVTRLYAGEGEEATVFEEVRLSEHRKDWVKIEDIAPCLKEAFLAAEDREFYRHRGVNLLRTARAAVNRVTGRAPVFGASTITQQVIKNISGDSELTLRRKWNEILRAARLEHRYAKDEIFEVYMNIVPLGENCIGVGAGSEVYFGKPPSRLELSEAATLVGITNAPTRYHPHKHPTACLEKRNRVLYAMYDAGYIDNATYSEAVSKPLAVLPQKEDKQPVCSWFAETVLSDIERDLVQTYGMTKGAASRLISRGGLQVYTTVDPTVQQILTRAFEKKQAEDGIAYAMVVCDSRNGDLRGIVGNVGAKRANLLLNHATVPHVPGSALKPIALYAPLLDEGRITCATVFDDVPLRFTEEEGNFVPYPQNYPARYDGLTTVSDALRLSKNTVALRLYEMRGAESIYRTLVHDLRLDGIVRSATGKDGRRLTDLSSAPLALGQLSYGVPLRGLTEAYVTFPSDGVFYGARSYFCVKDAAGNTLLSSDPAEKRQTRVFAPATARMMSQMLSEVTQDGTARSLTLGELIAVGGKTGTSGGDRDRLFVGFTPYYTAGIWCGYADGTRSLSGRSRDHLALWDEVMREIHVATDRADHTGFCTDGLVRCGYCRDSGALFCPSCLADPRGDRLREGYFTEQTLPRTACTRHVPVLYDAVTGAVAHVGCPVEDVKVVSLLRMPQRAFPVQITVSDAEYTALELSDDIPLGESFDVPYFIHGLPSGCYCGIGRHEKQFNSACYLHSDALLFEDDRRGTFWRFRKNENEPRMDLGSPAEDTNEAWERTGRSRRGRTHARIG